MKTLTTTLFVCTFLLVGCDGQTKSTSISMGQANEIAALSQDADQHQLKFAEAIQELSAKSSCQPEAMREHGGFWRVTGDNFYFIYCGYPMNIPNRWYFNPMNNKLDQDKTAM